MSIKYNLLVWSEDVSKFIKECTDKGIPKEINKLIILGSELKVDDLKALSKIDISYSIDNKYSDSKNLTEVFLLGMCFSEETEFTERIGLAGFSPLSKEVMDIAKVSNIPVINWTSLKGKISTRKPKNPSKTDSNKTTEAKKAPVKEKEASTKKNTPIKEKPIKETPIKEKSKKGLSIKDLIMNSSLSPEQKKYFTEESALERVKNAVEHASDENIGLPFQLKMAFGESGAALEALLKKNFKALRK